MKSTSVVAAAALMGGAAAGTHRMKLNKIPLDEQLKSATMHDLTTQLGQKYLRQSPRDFFRREMMAPTAGHKVPVNNYMNAQCKQTVA